MHNGKMAAAVEQVVLELVVGYLFREAYQLLLVLVVMAPQYPIIMVVLVMHLFFLP